MKRVFFALLILALINASYGQSVKTTCNWDSAPLRISPNVDDMCIVRVPIGAPITVISKANDLYYKVSFKSDTGYMKIASVIQISKGKDGTNINNSELFKDVPDENPVKKVSEYYTDATISGAIKLYGNENSRSQYQNGDYDAITLVWNCANGKYRSITYVFKGEYKKQSDFVSECIK